MTVSLRIVIADDDPDVCEYLGTVIGRLGHEVLASAHDGQQLVELCETHQPGLVVTDIKMPRMDGIEAADEINLRCPTPVIFVSAYHNPDLLSLAGSNHILAFLVKPVKPEDLEMAIALAIHNMREPVDSPVSPAEATLGDSPTPSLPKI